MEKRLWFHDCDKSAWIALFIFFLVMNGCSAQPIKELKKNLDNNTVLWQVSGKGLMHPSYLYGTFHILCKEDIHFSEELKTALKSSKEVYMEINLNDPSILLNAFSFINMSNEKNLSDLYTPEEYKKVTSYFRDSLHIQMTMLQKMKPYFLVGLLYPRMMNCRTSSGVEQELMKLAREDKKDIKGFETMAFQASVFDSIPYEWQARELLKNIDSFSFYKRQMDTMIRAYKGQRMDEMLASISKSEFGSDAFENILLKNRNIAWVNKLKTILPKENVLIAVGAGHLLGESGLIALLRKEGYRVDPIFNK